MLKPTYTTKFNRDTERVTKRGKDTTKLRSIIGLLLNESPLPAKCHDHALKGDLFGCRDCHIEPNWILIYAVSNGELVLYRTGTHSDILNK
ncbi:hypothetical protein AGMMS49957_08980 [Synergistales bacterium]|nr:hypothetical protein AGMMS49957_08980 [Synergistales bacterium]